MDFYSKHEIKRKFSIARTPQQNGVVERKNKTIQEMAQTMLMDSKLTDIFWTHAMHTTIHIQNKLILINNNLYIKVTKDNILLIEVYVDVLVLEVMMRG